MTRALTVLGGALILVGATLGLTDHGAVGVVVGACGFGLIWLAAEID